MGSNSAKSILCIEDEQEMIDLIRLILTRRGFQVKGANGGKEGLEIIHKDHPDLVLLDLMMPEMDGFAVLNVLQTDKELSRIPVIVVTAKELTAIEKQRLSGKAQSLMQKGAFTEQDIVDKMLEVLE